jgi:cysteinyl-tRNA synthetase
MSTLDEWYAIAAIGGAPAGVSELAPGVRDALLDDLNTPKAISELHQLRNAAIHGAGVTNVTSLVASLRALGFLAQSDNEWLFNKRKKSGVDEVKVNGLIAQRTAARKAKDFKESDRIRDELVKMGVVLKDSKDGTTWEVAR